MQSHQYPHQTTNSNNGYNHTTSVYDNNPTSNLPPNLIVQIDAIVQTVIELANKTICPNETLTEIIAKLLAYNTPFKNSALISSPPLSMSSNDENSSY